MTSTTAFNGRLCNQIFRNLAVSIIAKKHNLYVNYSSLELIEALGIKLFCGIKVHPDTVLALTDNNYFAILNAPQLIRNLDPNNAYFQTKEISNFLHDYLHENKSTVIEHNSFQERYNANNDLFIHVRLSDMAHNNHGIAYYLNAIQTVQFDNLFIATDRPSHSIIRDIRRNYPNTSHVLHVDEITTIQFGSTCKHIILSHGSFSAIIGYLSFFSTVHYPEYDSAKIWYGDMFSINGWIKHPTKI